MRVDPGCKMAQFAGTAELEAEILLHLRVGVDNQICRD
jgi:hypothetical protein